MWQSQNEMNKNGFAPLLILIIIAILGVVGYFGYKNLHQTTLQSTVDTSNWKAFNSKFGYTIKYPLEWNINISQPGGKGNSNPEDSHSPIFEFQCDLASRNAGKICTQILISSIPYNASGTIGQNLPSINIEDKLSPGFLIVSADKITNKINTKLDTEKAVGFEYFAPGYINTSRYVVVSDKDNVRYTITYEESQNGKDFIGPNDWKNKQIFDAMLSTFKFTK